MKKSAVPTSEIISCARDLSKDQITYLKKLISIESPSNDPFATRAVLNEMRFVMRQTGFHTCIVPGKKLGGYLYARPSVRNRDLPLQLVLGHCDTVWPRHTLDRMPIIDSEGLLKGPGVFDMKAGLTQILFALKILDDLKISPPLTPVILINSDEEIGSHESTTIIRRLAKMSARAFVLEPPMGPKGKLKTARKGIGRFTVSVKGDAAHSGLDPGKGASAILELSHQIQELFKMNDLERGISVNVGMIDGGLSPNVVAPTAQAVVDVRVMTEKDGIEITHRIKSLKAFNPNTQLIIEGKIGRPPMERSTRNVQLWSSAREMGCQMGLDLEQSIAGGGSDGNTTSQWTATLDGLGTVGDGAHAIHEHIQTEKLMERTVLLAHLMLIPHHE